MHLAEEDEELHRTTFRRKIVALKSLKSIDLDKTLLDPYSKVLQPDVFS